MWTSQANWVRLSEAAYSLCAALQQSIAELRDRGRTKPRTIAHYRCFIDANYGIFIDFRRF